MNHAPVPDNAHPTDLHEAARDVDSPLPADVGTPEPIWVDHITCDYPITGYHARSGGRVLCGWTGGVL